MSLVYLYSIVHAGSATWLADNQILGIGTSEVRTIIEGDLGGVVNDVAQDQFDQEALDSNVRDSDWLGMNAARHQNVNAQLHAGVGAVIPLAFGTVFRSEGRVKQMLKERGAELAEALEAITGRVEWVFTLERDATILAASVAGSADLQRLQDEAESSAPGRGYLIGRKREEARRQEARRLDAAARGAFQQAMQAVAEDLTEEPLVDGGPTARLTVLLQQNREAGLQLAVDEFNSNWSQHGYSARASGPWPPYRFGARIGALRE